MPRRCLLASAALAIVSLAVCPSAAAQTILSVPSQFTTIQGAIAAASTGDAIVVAPGNYVEDLDFLGKAIHVLGAQGASVTTVTGTGSLIVNPQPGVVGFRSGEGPSSILDGFTVTGGPRGIVCLNGASPTIRRCIIRANNFTYFGLSWNHGGGAFILGSSPTFIDCQVIENHLLTDSDFLHVSGGGVYCQNGSLTMTNCVIAKNWVHDGDFGSFGGGIYATQSVVTLRRCTLAANSSDFGCTDNLMLDTASMLDQCIVAGGFQFSAYCPGILPIWPLTVAPVTITHSLVTGGWAGTGNIGGDPSFVNVAADDFHLRPDSPCINAGNPVPGSLPAWDIDGDPRPLYYLPDMGADEWMPTRSFSLVLTQPSGPGSIRVANAAGLPNAPFVTLLTADPANAGGGLGMGTIAGLHISLPEILAQVQYAAAPFTGILDGSGASGFALPAGALATLAGMTFYGVTHLFDPITGAANAVSSLASLTIL